MNWYIWTPVVGAACWSLGLLMGLSLGFRVGTRRTIILFTQHFPTLSTMNELVRHLFKIAERLNANANSNKPPAG